MFTLYYAAVKAYLRDQITASVRKLLNDSLFCRLSYKFCIPLSKTVFNSGCVCGYKN